MHASRRATAIAALAAGLALSTPLPAFAQPEGCPPGLAKKDPACIPPGQAKTGAGYNVGDRITGGYVVVGDPGRYDLDPGQTYYRAGGTIYRVDADTRAVLDIIGGIAQLSN